MPPLPAELRLPHPARLRPDYPDRARIIALHEATLARGDDTYVDPATGWNVFTAAFLWRRGWCCDAGCRHCPFLTRA